MIHKELQARQAHVMRPCLKKGGRAEGTGEMAQWIVFDTKIDHQFDS